MNRAADTKYRLGVTSFVYQAGWADNVQRLLWGPARLAGRIRDVELLFFQADRAGQLPAPDEIQRLRRYKDDAGLSYTLHTPLDASLASADPTRRAEAVSTVRRSIDVARPLQPERIVVHVYLGDQEHDPQPVLDLPSWRDRAAASLQALMGDGVTARQLCVETIDYDFVLIEPVVERLGLSVALDAGHQLRDGRDELALWARVRPRTRVLQWHGVDPTGRDHRSLIHYPRQRARALLRALRASDYAEVLTLEVFREDDLLSSLALLAELEAELGDEARCRP